MKAGLYKFKKLPNEAKQQLDKVYPLLSIPKQVELGIDIQNNPFENRYKPYRTKITQFYNKYLNTDTFKVLVHLEDKGFLDVNQDQVQRTSFNSNNLQFATETFLDPKKGMKKDPYKPSPHANVRFFFIYHKPDRANYVVLTRKL